MKKLNSSTQIVIEPIYNADTNMNLAKATTRMVIVWLMLQDSDFFWGRSFEGSQA
jgi:hypothetical protein